MTLIAHPSSMDGEAGWVGGWVESVLEGSIQEGDLLGNMVVLYGFAFKKGCNNIKGSTQNNVQ